jgi:microcystin degradation protein MlrC
MRIACGGIQHETNTFATMPTALADFERDSGCGPEFLGGETLVSLYRNTGTIHGGYLDAAHSDSDIELLPLLCVRAQPAGRVTQDAYRTLRDLFLSRLGEAGAVDGVMLDLHGAMVSEDDEDAEGAFLAAVRDQVGAATPVFVTLDYHANITQRMADLADVIIGFDTYPHVDMRERGREAVELLARTIRGEVQPVQVFRQLPLLTMPPMQCTLRQPMQGLIEELHRLESEPGVLTATVSMGFPFADIHDAGVSVLVTTDGNESLASEKVESLAERVWSVRDDLQPNLVTIEETMRLANERSDGLVIFADGSDNPGGGAPCDGTVALRALIDADFQGAVVGILCDPETVEQAHRAGVGANIEARIGGKTDDRHGETVITSAYVRTLGDGEFVHLGPMNRGLTGRFGRTVVLVVGGVEVVVAEHRKQLLDAEMLRTVGIAPERKRLLVVKSAVHFRADLGPLAAAIYDADTPGIHRPDFAGFDYQHVRRPIYPLDSHATL